MMAVSRDNIAPHLDMVGHWCGLLGTLANARGYSDRQVAYIAADLDG